jgi:hypothetical protein
MKPRHCRGDMYGLIILFYLTPGLRIGGPEFRIFDPLKIWKVIFDFCISSPDFLKLLISSSRGKHLKKSF